MSQVCEICNDDESESGVEFEIHMLAGLECALCSNCERFADKDKED